MTSDQSVPDACNSDLGDLIARANKAGLKGLLDDALLFGIELDGHGTITSTAHSMPIPPLQLNSLRCHLNPLHGRLEAEFLPKIADERDRFFACGRGGA